jgi:hypothetical protein
LKESYKIKARSIGVTERCLWLMEECEKFLKENDEILQNIGKDIGSDPPESIIEKVERLEKISEKFEWFEEQIKLEKEKSIRPYRYLMKDKNYMKDNVAM